MTLRTPIVVDSTSGNVQQLQSSDTLAPASLGAGTHDSSHYLDGSGNFSVPPGAYSLPTASSSVLGGVKVGSGLSIAGDGTLSTSGGGGSADGSPVPVRQTVLSAATSSGVAGFISAGSGLAAGIAATATAVTIAFAAGFGAGGAVDYVGQITADTTVSSLTANSTNYIYADRNTSTGAITLGFSTLQPVYDYTAPSSPATDQHWFDLTVFQMKRYSGSAWVVYQRVFLGEAVTGASTVTSAVTYGLRGQYTSPVTAISAATSYMFNHNLGVAQDQCLSYVYTQATSGASWRMWLPYYLSSSTSYGIQINQPTTRNSVGIYVGNQPMTNDANTAFQSSGNVKVRVQRAF